MCSHARSSAPCSTSSRATRCCLRRSSTARSTLRGSTSAATLPRGTSGCRSPCPSRTPSRIWSGVTDRTRALFLSHVTSETAVQLPVQELCSRAREREIATIVDGAHVPGHIPLDLRALDVDYYAGNCHKWLCAPKGAGFLYVRRELQETIAPLVAGWGYRDESTFLSRHEEQGTRDPSAFLTVPDAIEWQEARNWDAVRERCRALAAEAPARLELEPLGADLQMVSMRLPPTRPPISRSASTTSTASRSPSSTASSAPRSRATTGATISRRSKRRSSACSRATPRTRTDAGRRRAPSRPGRAARSSPPSGCPRPRPAAGSSAGSRAATPRCRRQSGGRAR